MLENILPYCLTESQYDAMELNKEDMTGVLGYAFLNFSQEIELSPASPLRKHTANITARQTWRPCRTIFRMEITLSNALSILNVFKHGLHVWRQDDAGRPDQDL